MLHFSKWKTMGIFLIALLGIIFTAPNFFSKSALEGLPDWMPNKQVHLGLDLQGGSHLLLEMNIDELYEDWLKDLRSDIRQKMRDKKLARAGLKKTKTHVQLRAKNAEDSEKVVAAVKELIQSVPGSVFAGPAGDNLEVKVSPDGLIQVKPTEPAITARINAAMSAAISTIGVRVNALGTTEPIIQRHGRNRILIQVPGFDDPEALKEIVRKTAKLTFQLVDRKFLGGLQPGQRVPPGSEAVPDKENPSYQHVLKERVIVSGEDLVSAQPGTDPDTNRPVVNFRFNQKGGKAFAKVTKANVGRPFAIVLDNGFKQIKEADGTIKKVRDRHVISAPEIREAIIGGAGQISGNFTVKETTDLSILLRSGSLPTTFEIIEERTVGPSLGADSIAAGKMAAIIGLVGVVAFIIWTYGLFGVFANIALFVNITLIIAALSAFQATLTLPGIAGIVLTIGMAVDANVLIFERIREELRSGKSAISAIDSGYSRALGTILDANITTFIAAIILFWLGSGPIRGFAVTLSIGILTSVFTAFTFTRLLVALWLNTKRSRTIEVPI